MCYAAADVNLDGRVDGSDESAWLALLQMGGMNPVTGEPDRRMDLNGDGEVTEADFDLWDVAYRQARQQPTGNPAAPWMDDAPFNGVAEGGVLSVPTRSGTHSGGTWVMHGVDNRFGFAGYMWDPFLKLYHVRHRVYDPMGGRWLQRDPIGMAGGWNLYQYCGGEPWGFVDQDGKAPQAAGALIGAGIGAGVYLFSSWLTGSEVTWQGAFNATLSGAVGGLTFGLGAGWAAAGTAGIGSGFLSDVVGQSVDVLMGGRERVDWEQAAFSGITGGVFGVFGHVANQVFGPGAQQQIKAVAADAATGLWGKIKAFFGFGGKQKITGTVADARKPTTSSGNGRPSSGRDGSAPACGDAASYERGSFRKGTRAAVWEEAVRNSPDGVVRDPNTGIELKPGDPWDMGHRPGYEFRKHQESARLRGISRKAFLDEYNDPIHYRPEHPPSNRSRRHEGPDDWYIGP
jgi:RHS repeat-associated protein